MFGGMPAAPQRRRRCRHTSVPRRLRLGPLSLPVMTRARRSRESEGSGRSKRKEQAEGASERSGQEAHAAGGGPRSWLVWMFSNSSNGMASAELERRQREDSFSKLYTCAPHLVGLDVLKQLERHGFSRAQEAHAAAAVGGRSGNTCGHTAGQLATGTQQSAQVLSVWVVQGGKLPPCTAQLPRIHQACRLVHWQRSPVLVQDVNQRYKAVGGLHAVVG